MGLLATIMSKVFPAKQYAQTPAPAATGVTAPSPATASAGSVGAATPQPVPHVDVAAYLDGLASENPEKLDWKRSIVDLMKLVDMDSSLSARKELAAELGYTGDSSDSAAMNIWLHKQVIQKIAQNGGNVPAELLS